MRCQRYSYKYIRAVCPLSYLPERESKNGGKKNRPFSSCTATRIDEILTLYCATITRIRTDSSSIVRIQNTRNTCTYHISNVQSSPVCAMISRLFRDGHLRLILNSLNPHPLQKKKKIHTLRFLFNCQLHLLRVIKFEPWLFFAPIVVLLCSLLQIDGRKNSIHF